MDKKTRRLRILETVLLYVCLPAALIPLMIIGTKQLLGRRPPASAWILTGAGILLAAAWGLYLFLRKKPVTSSGCLCASIVLCCILIPIQVSLSEYHPAYNLFTTLCAVASLLFIASVIFWLIRHPQARSFLLEYVVTTGLYLLMMSLLMSSITELIYGRATGATFLRLAGAAAVFVLVRLPDIIAHFRKKAEGKQGLPPEEKRNRFD